jgi:hypothetical protein
MNGTFGFFGTQNIGYESNMELILNNVRNWIDINFQKLGYFDTITSGEINYDEVDLSKLSLINDEVYGSGVVYQSKFKNWVTESGLTYPAGISNPIICSGIYIDNVFYNKATTGDYSYHIDYDNGRVIFDDEPEITGIVQANFSRKKVEIFRPSRYSKEIYEQKYDNPQGEGEEISNSYKISMPLVNVTNLDGFMMKPYGLGGEKKIEAKIRIDVFSTDKIYGERILDILGSQKDAKIASIDFNNFDSKFDEYGDLNPLYSGISHYGESNPWRNIYILDAKTLKTEGEIKRGSVTYFIESNVFL